MRNQWSELIELLEAKNVIFTEGLTDSEVLQVESRHGFRFPNDLRHFLQTAVPKGYSFTDRRSGGLSPEMLNWPLHGILFDVEHNGFWLPEWGQQPASIDGARVIVEEQVRRAPKLIPIFSHRMMPDRPSAAGNPVLSVHQTDIIYYGFVLDNYLHHEFDLPGRKPWPSEIRPIEFWDVDRRQSVIAKRHQVKGRLPKI